jgi:nitrate/nitrite transporter NarK
VGKSSVPVFELRRVTLLQAVVMAVCLCGLMLFTSKYAFLVFFSILFGVTMVNFMPPIICAWKHFPDNRGTVTGIAMSGFCMGSLVFTVITKFLVNPQGRSPTIKVDRGEVVDAYYEPDVANNVPTMFMILMLVWLAMLCFTFVVLRDPVVNVSPEIDAESRNDSVLLARTSSRHIYRWTGCRPA